MASSLIGQTLGHYRVLDQVGAGGMGVVYRAQDVRLGRQVALKVLPAGSASSEEAVERFRREARTASALNHHNICTIYGFDEHEGQCYLAMELLDGEPLDKRLAGRHLDLSGMLDIGIQVGDALDAAHGEGILHRDIKPANIFITKRGQVKVLDFGLAKLSSDARLSTRGGDTLSPDHFSSVVGTTVGTIAYMSPEQARGEDLDPRTDLFSFGVVLYEMATGRQSFPGSTTAVVFDGILNREPAAPSTVNTLLPLELDRIISKALEKDRSLRYQTAADMRSDLQRLRRDSGTRRVPTASNVAIQPPPVDLASAATVFISPAAATATTDVGAPSGTSAPGSAPTATMPPGGASATVVAPRSKTPWLIAGLALGVAIVAIAAGFLLSMRPSDTVVEAQPQITAATEAAPPVTDTSAPPAIETLPPTVTPSAPTPAPPPASPPVATPGSAASRAGTNASGDRVPPAKGAANRTPAAPTAPGAPAAPAAPSRDAEAAQRMDVARAKLASQLIDQGVADLRQIVSDFPGSPIAMEAGFLAADALEKAGRAEDAMAAFVEFDRRFPGTSRIADSKLRRALLLSRARGSERPAQAYTVFGEVVRDFPGSPQARQALQARRQYETQRRLKATDPTLNIEVPALLVTLRTFADQFPSDPETMLALNQLATAYEDMDRYQAAADAWERMARQFPGNAMEVWFKLGELYDRRLKDQTKAREAYAKVPPESPRYREAQQRINRR